MEDRRVVVMIRDFFSQDFVFCQKNTIFASRNLKLSFYETDKENKDRGNHQRK